MKRLFSILLIFVSCLGFSQIQATFNYARFFDQEGNPYIDTYLEFVATSLAYSVGEDSAKHANVEVLQIFDRAGAVADFSKELVQGPAVSDTLLADFYYSQRFALDPNLYGFELKLTDMSADSVNPVKYKEFIELPSFDTSKVQYSDLLLVDNLQKTEQRNQLSRFGYDVRPKIDNFYSVDAQNLLFYWEVYNKQKLPEKPYLKFFLKTEEGDLLDGTQVIKPLNVIGDIIPVIESFSIDDLTSGSYTLVVQVIDIKGSLLAEQTKEIVRFSDHLSFSSDDIAVVTLENSFVKKLSFDSLMYFAQSMIPVCEKAEVKMLNSYIKERDTAKIERFIHTYFYRTNPSEAEFEFEKFKEQVYYVDRAFKSRNRYGFETDRGYVYLKYGAPNATEDQPNEPGSYPYQIWQYYELGGQRNVIFIFYSTNIALGEYQILHSTLRGEYYNEGWRYDLHKRNTVNGTVDGQNQNAHDHYGGRSSDLLDRNE